MIADPLARALVGCIREALPGLVAVYVYGSRAEDRSRPDSDLDVALLLPQGASLGLLERLDLASRLGHLAGCFVDLSVLDLRKGVVHAKEVVTAGRPLFVGDPRAVEEFEMAALSRYARLNEDRSPVLKAYLIAADARG